MSVNEPLTGLEYGDHGKLRGDYKFYDYLVSSYNWEEKLSSFENKIERYLDSRRENKTIGNKSLINVGIPLEKTTTFNFQTLSGEVLNHTMIDKVGDLVQNQYETYTLSSNI